MGTVRLLLGYTKLDRQRSLDTRKRLKVQSTVKEIQTYKENRKEHVERIQDDTH
jgi:hypothetical protein